MNGENICPYCGAKINEYWHPMTLQMTNALIEIARQIKKKGENIVHTRKDCDLNKIEWANITKLRFHGLIAKYKEDGHHLSGYWCLTNKGLDFLKGEKIPVKVKTYRNQVIEHSEEMVDIYKIKKGMVSFGSDEFDIKIHQYKLI